MIPTIRLTQPTLIALPFHRAGWIYEEKVDGWRMLAYNDGAAVKLVSRNGCDHAKRFPTITAAIRAMSAPTLVLDGEVAVFDRTLISRFEWLRHSAAGPGRTCWTARTWCSRCGAWPRTAWRPGRTCSRAATKAWWRRIRRHPTAPAARCPGSR